MEVGEPPVRARSLTRPSHNFTPLHAPTPPPAPPHRPPHLRALRRYLEGFWGGELTPRFVSRGLQLGKPQISQTFAEGMGLVRIGRGLGRLTSS